MPLNIAAIRTEEGSSLLQDILNGSREDFTGNAEEDFRHLDQLRRRSLPDLEQIKAGIETKYGLSSEISLKSTSVAQQKCLRPSTIQKYPWFQFCHIRDYLRFRTRLNATNDFETLLHHFAELQAGGRISIVKIDVGKLFSPGVFGWRMAAVDMRLNDTRMLIEHYMSFRDLIDINDAWLHRVFEFWRTRDTDALTVGELRGFRRDAGFSRHAYREMLLDAVLREDPGSGIAAARIVSNDVITRHLRKWLT